MLLCCILPMPVMPTHTLTDLHLTFPHPVLPLTWHSTHSILQTRERAEILKNAARRVIEETRNDARETDLQQDSSQTMHDFRIMSTSQFVDILEANVLAYCEHDLFIEISGGAEHGAAQPPVPVPSFCILLVLFASLLPSMCLIRLHVLGCVDIFEHTSHWTLFAPCLSVVPPFTLLAR